MLHLWLAGPPACCGVCDTAAGDAAILGLQYLFCRNNLMHMLVGVLEGTVHGAGCSCARPACGARAYACTGTRMASRCGYNTTSEAVQPAC